MIIGTRELAYKATVQGFDAAAAAIGATDDAAAAAEESIAGAGDAAQSAGAQFAGAEAKAAGLAGGLKGAGAEAKASGNAMEAFEKRVGLVGKVLGGFGLLALPGAVQGLVDLARSAYEWTDAGAAAAAQAEATAGAIDAMVAKLTAQTDATRVSTDAIWSMINAQVAQELASKGLTKTTAEIVEKQAEYAQVLRDLAIHKERGTGLDIINARTGTAVAGAQSDLTLRAERLRGELVALNATWEDQRAQLAGATDLLNRATATIDLQGGTVVPKATRSVSELAHAFGALGAAADTGLAMVTDALPGLIGGTPILDAFAGGVRDMADDAVSALDGLRGAIRATADEKEDAARRARAAAALEVAAYSASAAAAIGSVASLAEALGAGAKLIAGIRIAEEIAGAASETAKAIAAGAAYDIPGAIAHGAAAAAHVAAAVKWGSDALGGGGGSTPSASVAQPTPPRPTDDGRTLASGDRERGGGGVVNNFFEFKGQPMHTVSDIQDGVARTLDESGYRRGAARIDFNRIQRRG